MPISAEARDWAIEQIKAHGEYSSLDDLLQQADVLARYFGKSPEEAAGLDRIISCCGECGPDKGANADYQPLKHVGDTMACTRCKHSYPV